MKKADVRKIIKEEINKVLNEKFKTFKEFAKEMIDYEIENAKEVEFPNLESHLKRLENLRKITDPKKFRGMYMRVTGANRWDLSDEWLNYL